MTCPLSRSDNVVKTSFYQLLLLVKVKHFLSRHNLEKVIHALLTSSLDYSNVLYVGVSQSSLSLQLYAAHPLTNKTRRDALNGLASSYLSEILTFREHGRALGSSDQLLLEVPRSKYRHWGD